jgi:hypothetical protein
MSETIAPPLAPGELEAQLSRIAADANEAMNKIYYLHETADTTFHDIWKACTEAAAELTRLQSRIRELEEALRRILRAQPIEYGSFDEQYIGVFETARAALAREGS